MGSTIFHAPAYDPRRERRKKILVVSGIVIILVGGLLAYRHRFFTYERLVNQFFNALEQKEFERAYAIWMADPEWKQHPERYSSYRFDTFYRDWGPSGEWGVIRSAEVEGATNPGGTGVVVRV